LQITFALLKLLEYTPSSYSKVQEFANTICEDHRQILIELTSDEIGSLLNGIERLARAAANNVLDLPIV